MDTVEPLPFKVEVDAQGRRTVLRLAGELDMAAVPELEEVLLAAQHENTTEVVIDLRGLSFLDSMGLSALVRAHVAGREAHRKVSFVPGSNVVNKVIQLTKMDDRLDWIELPEQRDEPV